VAAESKNKYRDLSVKILQKRPKVKGQGGPQKEIHSEFPPGPDADGRSQKKSLKFWRPYNPRRNNLGSGSQKVHRTNQREQRTLSRKIVKYLRTAKKRRARSISLSVAIRLNKTTVGEDPM